MNCALDALSLLRCSSPQYEEQWLTGRRELPEAMLACVEAIGTANVQHRDHATDAGGMRNHVLPYIGSMKLPDVRPKHLTEWIRKLRDHDVALAAHRPKGVRARLGDVPRLGHRRAHQGEPCWSTRGAIAGPRWRHLDMTAAPLARLTSSRTCDGEPMKTGKASRMRLHPVLADLLAS
jgi:hypothetical protein